MTEAIESTSQRISHDLVQMMPATAYTSEDVYAVAVSYTHLTLPTNREV